MSMNPNPPNPPGQNNDLDKRKVEFETALAQRNFEIGNFWSRGWFFGGLLVAIGAAYFGAAKDAPDYCVFLAFLGMLVALFQSLMNRGSKYWQERWETKTKRREKMYDIDTTRTGIEDERYYLDAAIVAKNENGIVRARRFSVSKLTILVWDILTLAWLFLWIDNCNFTRHPQLKLIRWPVVVAHLGIVIYIFLFFFSNINNTTLRDGVTPNRIRRWHFLKFRGGGGGKVYERLVRKRGMKDKNVAQPFFDDSEDYVNDKLPSGVPPPPNTP
jgi:hypothetical protein